MNGCQDIINIIRRYFLLWNVAKVWRSYCSLNSVWCCCCFFLYLLLRVFLKRYTSSFPPIVVQLHILKLTSSLIWVYLKASLFFRSTHKEGKFSTRIFYQRCNCTCISFDHTTACQLKQNLPKRKDSFFSLRKRK